MQQCPAFIEWPDYQHSYGFVRLHGALMGVSCTDIDKTIRGMAGDVPLFVEHCEAVAAKVDVKRRWLGEQGCRVSFCFGEPPVQHVTLEAACEPSVFGSLWLLPA